MVTNIQCVTPLARTQTQRSYRNTVGPPQEIHTTDEQDKEYTNIGEVSRGLARLDGEKVRSVNLCFIY